MRGTICYLKEVQSETLQKINSFTKRSGDASHVFLVHEGYTEPQRSCRAVFSDRHTLVRFGTHEGQS